ncbi:MAG: hypothetical protein JW783_13460 [Bacteroidales bacterium]|nr:hypothetical protein [Bacteroidales bacterium]
MNAQNIANELVLVDSIIVSIEGSLVTISNPRIGNSTTIDSSLVSELSQTTSPWGELCIQLFMVDGGGIIVTPTDFVFSVEQDEFVLVPQTPSVCSLRELEQGLELYCNGALDANSIDSNTAHFYMHYYILKSANRRGFNVASQIKMLKSKADKSNIRTEELSLFTGI